MNQSSNSINLKFCLYTLIGIILLLIMIKDQKAVAEDNVPKFFKENDYLYTVTTPSIVTGDIDALGSLTKMKYLEDKHLESQGKPKISFRKVNPTKCLVKVEEATDLFWLVFSESFHKGWRAYVNQKSEIRSQKSDEFETIIAEYPKLGVKEAKHLQKFTPQDIEYLFRKEDIKEHYLVNGYANAWYIDPKELGLGEDFVVTLYFWPQSLFYLGLLISGLTLMGCFVYLPYDYFRNKKVTRNS